MLRVVADGGSAEPPTVIFSAACCSLCRNPDTASTRDVSSKVGRHRHGAGCQKCHQHSDQGFCDSVTQIQVLILFPGVRSVGSVCAPSELLVSKRYPGSVQDPLGDLLVRGEVPQAVSTVAPPCSVVKDCW